MALVEAVFLQRLAAARSPIAGRLNGRGDRRDRAVSHIRYGPVPGRSAGNTRECPGSSDSSQGAPHSLSVGAEIIPPEAA
jgi:hypothetical protein